MRLRRPCLLITLMLCAALLCAGCPGKDDTNPLKINPEKDIHGLYQKVVKEREQTAKQRQKAREAEPRPTDQTGTGGNGKQ